MPLPDIAGRTPSSAIAHLRNKSVEPFRMCRRNRFCRAFDADCDLARRAHESLPAGLKRAGHFTGRLYERSRRAKQLLDLKQLRAATRPLPSNRSCANCRPPPCSRPQGECSFFLGPAVSWRKAITRRCHCPVHVVAHVFLCSVSMRVEVPRFARPRLHRRVQQLT